MSVMKMTKTVMKSLFSKSATQMYPIKKREFKKNTRGQIGIEIENCIYCGICSRKCPTGGITVSKQEKSWEIDRLKCINCNFCVESCPKKCLTMANQYTEPSTSNNKKDVFKDARVPDNTTDNQNS